MKKSLISLMFVSLILFTGCGSKPEIEQLIEIENKDLKSWEMIPFLKAIDFEVQREKELDDGSYIIQGFPIIKVEQPFFREFLYEKNTTSNKFKRAVVKFEYLKDFSEGKLDSTELVLKLDDNNRWQKDFLKPRGTLRQGDEFRGMQRTFTFKETENGWTFMNN
ncbi:hypothetical protein [Halarcobacter sp.]|uniref:hypothetical protein n=1 Tax=Halarcobacter sp. TaxID=2321133 RepID=UPI003A92BBB5